MQASRQDVEYDDEGYLVDPESWTPDLARQLAADEDIALTGEHWAAIDFVRRYHAERGITPDIRHVAAHMAAHLGFSKKAAKERMFTLFPLGYVAQTCKIAGMRKPRAWSTG